jgi:acyl carrier protein
MTDTTFRTVVRALEQTVRLDPDAVSISTRIDDLGIGRFSRLRLAIYLEEACQLEIRDEDIAFFETVGDIVKYVDRWSLDLAA